MGELESRSVDQLAAMRVFVRAIERGSFTRAASDLKLTPSAVSKLVRRLEARDPDDGEELTIEDRRALAGVLTLDAQLGDECLAMMHAIERMCDGLLAALTARSPDRLPLPGLRA